MSDLMYRVLKRVPRSWINQIANIRGRYRWLKRSTDWIGNSLRQSDCVIQEGLGKGLRFNSGGSAAGFVLGTHDEDVQFVLHQLLKKGDIVFDMGANVGFTAVIAAKCVGPQGRVHCFEPLPSNAKQIRINSSMNQFDSIIEVHEIALSDADGEATFTVSRGPTWGRLESAGDTPETTGAVTVQVRTLDAYREKHSIPVPNFIKMDIEGAEAQALAASAKTLADSNPILVIELHHTYDEVNAVLNRLGYCSRPLTRGGTLEGTDGEFQIIAYRKDNVQGEEFWNSFIKCTSYKVN